MGIKIEIHQVDDWEALYVDGVLTLQQHSGVLSAYLNERLGDGPVTIDSIVRTYHDEDAVYAYAERTGRLPNSLSEIAMLEVERLKERVSEAKDHLAAATEVLNKAEEEYRLRQAAELGQS